MDLILHHYDFSSFSEKVRLVLGLKNLRWLAVEIPSYAPKPDYEPLTAGYRRTPALQIGADVYCDTQLIVEVLETLAPIPTIYPGLPPSARAAALAIVDWAETQLFWPVALYITGLHAARFPPEFHRDRARLHGKPEPSLAQVAAAAPRYEAEVRGQLARLEALLDNGRPFVSGLAPGLADFALYGAPWFLQLIGGPSALLEAQPRTLAWMERVASLGHGESRPITADEALRRAALHVPVSIEDATDAVSPEGLVAGERVTVRPLTENSPAHGRLLRADSERISIATDDPRTGPVQVHFPRLGYRLSRAR